MARRAPGTIHHVARADTVSLARAADFLGRHLDEPLGDPAVLPTFLLAEEARRHVKVILGGEGADELFGGYPTYLGHRLANGFARWPSWFRERLLRPLIESLALVRGEGLARVPPEAIRAARGAAPARSPRGLVRRVSTG